MQAGPTSKLTQQTTPPPHRLQKIQRKRDKPNDSALIPCAAQGPSKGMETCRFVQSGGYRDPGYVQCLVRCSCALLGEGSLGLGRQDLVGLLRVVHSGYEEELTSVGG